MKILHVVPTYYPAVRYGGPIYSVHALCQSLAGAGHDVHVFTTSVDGPGDSDVPHSRPIDIDGVQVHYFRSRWLRRLYYSTDLKGQLSSMVGDFDIVHLHSVFLFPTWAGARAAMRAGVPYVLSPRGMLVRDLITRRSTLTKRTWIRLIEHGNLVRAARIHLTSEEERRALSDLGLALAPTTVIPNGIDAPISFSPDAVSADVHALVAEGFDILSFGRINWKKGLDRLVKAMAEMPDVRAVIAGYDDEGFEPSLRRVAEECGVGKRLRFLPRQISGPDKEALFDAARLFTLPSLSENFGNVVAEAMIRALPVVVTEGVGASEIVEASGGGVVVGIDHRQLAAALSSLLKSDELLAAMGAAGANYARERLTWKNISRRFEDMYRETSALSENSYQQRQLAGT
jgi:glycosyltransferase involved in cell wall biosynthesis